MKLIIDTFPVGLFQCNCSIIACPETKEVIIIDPGDEYRRIIKKVKDNNYTIKYLIHTHAHLDHFGATNDIKNNLGGTTVMHEGDQFLYKSADIQAKMLGLSSTTISPIDEFIEDEKTYQFGIGSIRAIHTPGHTPGSCCFCLENANEQLIFSGDTLFQGSIGRTDLPGGDSELIKKSIQQRLYTLSGDSIVIPGHGEKTLLGEEQINNPFVRKF